MLFLMNNLGAMLQTNNTPGLGIDNWFQFGLAGLLIALMITLIKYIRDKDKEESKERLAREDKLAIRRSEMYREDNKVRDERWTEAVDELKEALTMVDKNYREAGDKFIAANRESIERFIGVVNKQMDQNAYVAEVLTGLKTSVERMTLTNKTEFESLKNNIIDRLGDITLNYELKPKDRRE